MVRLGADPAKGFPVHRRHPVDKQEKHLQERRRAGLFTDIRGKAGEGIEDAQAAAEPLHIGEDIESRLRLQAADPRDGIETGHDQVAAHLEGVRHLFDRRETFRRFQPQTHPFLVVRRRCRRSN